MTPSPSLGSVPGTQQAPPPVNPQGGNPLLGTSAPLPQAGPTPDQRVSAYMDQIRNLHIGIDGLATQHPEAADELGQAKQALTNSMAKVAAAQAQNAPSQQPPTF